MKPQISQISRPTKFNLSAFGQGTVTEVLHKGKTFHVYRATLGGREVVLKTPAPGLTGNDLFVKSIFSGSETFVATEQGVERWNHSSLRFDPLKAATGILLVEAQLIQQTAGAWNHEVITLGAWDGLAKCWDEEAGFNDEPLDLRFWPVLVLPYHDAVPFSTLPSALQRSLFPRMLPALWEALSGRRHGDLADGNFLINQKQNLFHLIDPGGYLYSDTQQFFGDRHLSIFMTTPANYPIIPPFSAQTYHATGLVNHLQNYLPYDRSAVAPVEHSPRPAACDVLAMGIIYYRILTGKEIFLGPSGLLEKPAWEHNYITPAFKDQQIYSDLIAALSQGYLKKELDNLPLTQGEKRLVHALLNLEIEDKEHLLRLS